MTDAFTPISLQLVSPQTQLASARTEDGAGVLQSPALAAIIRERIEQVERHGFTQAHDDLHDECELARGAVAYVTAGMIAELDDNPIAAMDHASAIWPWDGLLKPTDYQSCLIKAAAMLWAEADRIGRAQELIDAFHRAPAWDDDGRTCRRCGCTQTRACATDEGPCMWIAEDLCSACAGKPDPVSTTPQGENA